MNEVDAPDLQVWRRTAYSLTRRGIPMVHAPSLQHPLPGDNARFQVSQVSSTGKALAESEALCRAKGVRLTPIRRRVLEVLLGAPKPLGAYDLADSLASQGRRMAPITVYRALDFLIEQGLAHRLASRNAYIASTGSHRIPAFLICDGCGEATEITCSDVAETVRKVLTAQGYQPLSRALEITGRCQHCQDVH
jgi:Fur family zinc uptake transcriptional regulator